MRLWSFLFEHDYYFHLIGLLVVLFICAGLIMYWANSTTQEHLKLSNLIKTSSLPHSLYGAYLRLVLDRASSFYGEAHFGPLALLHSFILPLIYSPLFLLVGGALGGNLEVDGQSLFSDSWRYNLFLFLVFLVLLALISIVIVWAVDLIGLPALFWSSARKAHCSESGRLFASRSFDYFFPILFWTVIATIFAGALLSITIAYLSPMAWVTELAVILSITIFSGVYFRLLTRSDDSRDEWEVEPAAEAISRALLPAYLAVLFVSAVLTSHFFFDPIVGLEPAYFILLFSLMIPLLNGFLDFFSVGISRSLLMRLVKKQPIVKTPTAALNWFLSQHWLHLIVDVIFAYLSLAFLALFLPFVMSLANAVGQNFLEFKGVQSQALIKDAFENPFTEGFWVSSMLLTTLLPTFIHTLAIVPSIVVDKVLSQSQREKFSSAIIHKDKGARIKGYLYLFVMVLLAITGSASLIFLPFDLIYLWNKFTGLPIGQLIEWLKDLALWSASLI